MIEIPVIVNGVPVQATLTDEALTLIAVAITQPETVAPSPYMTIVEAADYLRCTRQRIDDLLSSRRLTRYKDGRRTLVSHAEIEQYVNPC